MKEVAKPYRNQRVSRPRQRSQQHLLEVSIRASKAREQRLRKVIGAVFKLTLLAALLAGTWLGAREAAQRFFWDNPSFFLTDIRVDTDGTLTREQILAASVQQGRNIFRTDLAGARSNLDKLPQIERVAIRRTLPNRLDITITERQPIAWVAAQGDVEPSASERSFLMDARGYVMKSHKILPEYLLLPVIQGVETGNLVAGQKVATFEMQAALDLLRFNADSTRWQVRGIDLSKGYCLVVTDQNRAQITFNLDHIEAQLARLYRLLDHIQPTQQEIRTVNLFVERNTPVTFFEPPVPEEPAKVPEPAELTKVETKSPVETAKAKSVTKEKKAGDNSTSSSRKRVSSSKPSSSTSRSSRVPAKKTSVESLKRPFRM